MPKPPEPPEPPIHRAARLGDLFELERLLAAGADINARADLEVDNGPYLRGLTPLMVAARSIDGASVSTLKWLLDHGADLHAQSEGDTTAAWYAGGKGGRWEFHDWHLTPDHAERLRFLLDAGANIVESPGAIRTLLTEACYAADPAAVALLLDRGLPHTPPNAIAISDRLKAGKAKSATERLQEMLASGEEFDPLNFCGRGNGNSEEAFGHFQLPIFCAASSGSAECVKLLLDHGANPNLRDYSMHTPLMHAGSPEVARTLLAAGADLHAVDDGGRDVLRIVLDGASCDGELCGPNRFAVADVLADAGADLTLTDEFHSGRLYSAAFSHNAGAVEWLLRRGVVDRSGNERTALHGICWQGEYEDDSRNTACEQIINALVAAGFDVNARDDSGCTPMHEAAHGDWGNSTAIRILLRHGAQPDPVSENGATPLMLAACNGELTCVQLLLDAGADPSLQNNKGASAIEHARDHTNSWELICALPPDMPAFSGFEQNPADVAKRHSAKLDLARKTLALLERAARK